MNPDLKREYFYLTEMLKRYIDLVQQDGNDNHLREIVTRMIDGANQASREHETGTFNMAQVIAEFDKALAGDLATNTNTKNIKCGKGCSFCCYIKVDAGYYEAKLIYDYCKEKEITINWDYLTAQSALPEDEKFWTTQKHLRKCEFLKNNECSIYEVRPFGCRKHFSIDDPNVCNVDVPGQMFRRPLVLNAEIFQAALWNSSIPTGTLSQMLLKVKEEDEKTSNRSEITVESKTDDRVTSPGNPQD